MHRNALAVAVLVFVTSLGGRGGLILAQGINNPPRNGCKDLPSWDALRNALRTARAQTAAVDPTRRDNIVFDITPQSGGDTAPGAGQMPGLSAGGFGHA